jgi:hypothetical protein
LLVIINLFFYARETGEKREKKLAFSFFRVFRVFRGQFNLLYRLKQPFSFLARPKFAVQFAAIPKRFIYYTKNT